MKVSELTTPYEKRRVITYNADQTKAVYHNRSVRHLIGNLYCGENERDGYGTEHCDVYMIDEAASVGLWLGGVNVDYSDTEVAQYAERDGRPSMENFVSKMRSLIEAREHVRLTDIEYAKNVAPELEQALTESRLAFKRRRDAEYAERAEKRAAEEAAFVKEKNDEAEGIVEAAEHTIRVGGTLGNDCVTFYRSKYDCSTYSVVNHLFRKYGISVPLRTQGWINDRLYDVEIKDGKCGSFRYQRSARSRTTASTVFGTYMNLLIEAVTTAKKAED